MITNRAREANGPAQGQCASIDDVTEALRDVLDPELGLNVVELGMVYDIAIDEDQGEARISMTLTSMSCPLWELFVEQINEVVPKLPRIESSRVEFVHDPPWHPGLMDPAAREHLEVTGLLPRQHLAT